ESHRQVAAVVHVGLLGRDVGWPIDSVVGPAALRKECRRDRPFVGEVRRRRDEGRAQALPNEAACLDELGALLRAKVQVVQESIGFGIGGYKVAVEAQHCSWTSSGILALAVVKDRIGWGMGKDLL